MKKHILMIISVILIAAFITAVFASCALLGVFNKTDMDKNNEKSDIPSTPEKALKKLESLGFKIFNGDEVEDEFDFEAINKFAVYSDDEDMFDIDICDFATEDELCDLYTADLITGYVEYFKTDSNYKYEKSLWFDDYDGFVEDGWEIVDGSFYYYIDKDKGVGRAISFCDEYKMIFSGLISFWEDFSS